MSGLCTTAARAQLARCVRLEREVGPHLSARGRRLLRRAAFQAYLDLRDAGRVAEARAILAGGDAR